MAEIGWYHSIDLGQGVVTPGLSRTSIVREALPEFRERSVLDIGAWDGYYSFLAEREGARHVVALDHYMWRIDYAAREAYWQRCAGEGVIPDPDHDSDFLTRDDLPGRRGFDLARTVLHSRVEPVVADFMTADLDRLGRFDVVLMLGVLYHLVEPFTALRRLRALTREVAVIETEALHVEGLEDVPLLRFVAGDEINHDYSNWMLFSETGLHDLCRAAGFRRIETRVAPPPEGVRHPLRQARTLLRGSVRGPAVRHYRLLVHAYAGA